MFGKASSPSSSTLAVHRDIHLGGLHEEFERPDIDGLRRSPDRRYSRSRVEKALRLCENTPNLIVPVAILAAFDLRCGGRIRKNPACEQPRPWWIWVVGYILATVVVILRWNHQWYDLVYPINCILLHSSVPLLRVARQKFKTQPN